MDRYRRIRVLGAGSFGIAWLTESNFSGKNYALKELNVSSMSERDRHLALNEVKILSKLKHKNVVRYKEAFVHDSKLFIAMEFAKQGDLSARIKQQNGQYFKEQKILEWFSQLCLALKHIHARNILHRDLKTENIFLGKDDVIKLGDFGIARVLDSTTDHAQTAVGTPYYMSPEICQHKLYNHKSDMWSLGCVLYELAALQHPFTADSFSVLVIKILQGEYPPIPSCFGPLLEDLISVLLNRNPEQRPSAKQLLHVPAMRPYVEMYVSYDHSRINSDAPKVSMPDERSRQCDNEERINSRNLERDGNQKKHAKKYNAASENNENVSLGDSKQKLSSSQAGSSTKALKPINCTEKQKSYQARETGLRNRTYTVICAQCPCAFHTPTMEKKKREIKTNQSESCEDQSSGHKKHVRENRDEPFAKNFGNHPPAEKFTICEEKPELNNIADSAFARIEALRMFLESRLGTRLLTHAYRYLTRTSPKEKESEVYMDLTELLGTEHVAYVPILLQLIACETMLYQ